MGRPASREEWMVTADNVSWNGEALLESRTRNWGWTAKAGWRGRLAQMESKCLGLNPGSDFGFQIYFAYPSKRYDRGILLKEDLMKNSMIRRDAWHVGRLSVYDHYGYDCDY